MPTYSLLRPKEPPLWQLSLAGILFLILLAGVLFSRDLILRQVVFPTVDFDRTGMQVYQFAHNFILGESDSRQLLPDARFKASGPNKSALGAAVLRLEEPTSMHFLLECDDFGNLSINGHKYINQGKKESPHNSSQAIVKLEAGEHLVLVELNNLGGDSWLTLKTRTKPEEDWRYMGDDMAFHPVMLSIFPNWWKAIPIIERACSYGLVLLGLAVAWFFRRWRPLAYLYVSIRNARDWVWELEANANRPMLKKAVFAFPLLLFAAMLITKILDHDLFRHIAWEDSSFEYIQFVCYSTATLITLGIVIKTAKQGLTLHCLAHGVLLAGLFFVSMEEISWGQRIFNLDNPEFFAQNNVQREISFHNLNVVAPFLHDFYILVGLFGASGWYFLKKLNLKPDNVLHFCVPDWFLATYFLPAFVVYTIYTYVIPHGAGFLGIDPEGFWNFFALYDQEGVELILSLGFLALVSLNYIRLRRMVLSNTLRRMERQPGAADPAIQPD